MAVWITRDGLVNDRLKTEFLDIWEGRPACNNGMFRSRLDPHRKRGGATFVTSLCITLWERLGGPHLEPGEIKRIEKFSMDVH